MGALSLQSKLILYAVVGAAIAVGISTIHHRWDAQGYDRATRENAAAVAQRLLANRATEEADRVFIAERDKSREDRIRELEARAAGSVAPTVRLCLASGGAGALPAAPAIDAGPGDPAAPGLGAADGQDYRQGPDIGPDLRRYALDCQRMAITFDEALKAAAGRGPSAP